MNIRIPGELLFTEKFCKADQNNSHVYAINV